MELRCDPDDVVGLRAEIQRRDRIIDVLMDQDQRILNAPNNDVALLETTFLLEGEVERRTEELERAKADAEAARSRLAAAISNMSEGFALFDRDDRLRLCNRTYLKLWDLSEEAIGRTFDDLLIEVASRVGTMDEAFLTRRRLNHREARGTTECAGIGGRQLQVRERRTADGYTVGVYADITEVSDAQQQILRNAIENIDQGLAMFDAELRMVAWNRRFVELNGLPLSLARRGLPLAYIVPCGPSPSDESQAAMDDELALVRQGQPYRIERCRPDGTILEVIGRPLADGGFVATYTDITASVQANRQLEMAKVAAERANEAKSRFLAAASHDLRQPLQALCLYLEVLHQKLPPTAAPVMGKIQICIGSLNELLADLLDLSKLDAGVVLPKMTDVSLAEVLERVVACYAGVAWEKGLRLRIVACDKHIRSDTTLFERVIANLVSNAVRYTQSGGVLIGCRRRQGRLWLYVCDSGIGIPDDKLDIIFEEFRQLANPERSREKGTGLGLAIVRKTARLLGMEVRVSSKLGKGSTFAISLPDGAP